MDPRAARNSWCVRYGTRSPSSVWAASASTVSEEQEIDDQVDDRTSDRVYRQPLLPTPATVPGALLHRRHLLRHRGGPFHPHRVLRAACPLRSCVVHHARPRDSERGRRVNKYAGGVLNWGFRGGRCCFFFFNDTATTEIYTLSLHDALPISIRP